MVVKQKILVHRSHLSLNLKKFILDVKLPLVMEGSIMIKLLPKWNKGYQEFAQCIPLGRGKQMMLQSAISSLSITAMLSQKMGLIMIKLLPKWNKGYEEFALYGLVRQGTEVFASISFSSTNKETTSVGVTLHLVSPPAPQMYGATL
ncbi:hypothetical protein C5167_034325 [Papaver somniferum]|uniref:Uncharacterized protein n=1 Tax=Papaver somniferum TaxID=3469 RepID=A0A4Y7KGX6_PAPSO|nr:hypothetical protein C5167_034325 [Papaver somniferum]